uniref:Uncharacterized protein n=1 Tax=Tetranychus urticae TaxID=32264 RepID=T1JWY8_TETUR
MSSIVIAKSVWEMLCERPHRSKQRNTQTKLP